MPKKVIIVGAGPAGLMAAQSFIKSGDYQVHVFDANKAVARKFLVAGQGGFNLSNSEAISSFVLKYNHPFIQTAVERFTNNDTVNWLSEIGIETYIGSSGKIFPKKGLKPIEVLNAWTRVLSENNCAFHLEHRFIQFDGKIATFQTPNGTADFAYDYIIFALGGSSWKITGSDGQWTTFFKNEINIIPFEASNAGVEIACWDSSFGGMILKNTEVCIAGNCQFGEIELTSYGLEGAPIYALNNFIREGAKELILNFKPTKSNTELVVAFSNFKGTKTEFLREIKLSKAAILLIKKFLSKEEFLADDLFLKAINQLTLDIKFLRPIDEAISTVGGISMDEIDGNFQFIKLPNHFCVGEMLDWDAPTGGYLLQACFATGMLAAKSIIDKNTPN